MMVLRVNDDELRAWLDCEFCEKTFEWPFSSTTIGAGKDPDTDLGVQQVITSHFSGSGELQDLDF
jgi:hypothetical protein